MVRRRHPLLRPHPLIRREWASRFTWQHTGIPHGWQCTGGSFFYVIMIFPEQNHTNSAEWSLSVVVKDGTDLVLLNLWIDICLTFTDPKAPAQKDGKAREHLLGELSEKHDMHLKFLPLLLPIWLLLVLLLSREVPISWHPLLLLWGSTILDLE